MRLRSLAYIGFCIFLFNGCSQDEISPTTSHFIKLYGRSGLNAGIAIETNLDNEFLLVGNSISYSSGRNDQDICLIKTDEFGNRNWISYYDDLGFEEAISAKINQKGEIFVFGNWRENTLDTVNYASKYFLMKTSPEGELIWKKKYGNSSEKSIARSFNLTSDGNVVMAGNTVSSSTDAYTQIYILKVNEQGETIWESRFGFTDSDNNLGNSIVEIPGNGFYLCGTQTGHNLQDDTDSDIRIMKLDNYGSVEWSRHYGGPAAEMGVSLQTTPFGIYFVGTTLNSKNNQDIFLGAVDFNGSEIFTTTFGGPANDFPCSISYTSDNTLTICGTTESFGLGMKDIYLVKTNTEGTEIWNRTFGSLYDDFGGRVIQSSNGDLVITGTISSANNTMIGLLKANANGRLTK